MSEEIDKESRTEKRKPFVNIIHYSHPSLNSGVHKTVYSVTKKLASKMPRIKSMINSIVTNNTLSKIIAPMKNTALTADISKTGMGFLTTEPIETGQEIMLFSRVWLDKPVNATVVWCKKHSDCFYRIGVNYGTM